MKNPLKMNWYHIINKNQPPNKVLINASFAEYLRSTGKRVTKIKGKIDDSSTNRM